MNKQNKKIAPAFWPGRIYVIALFPYLKATMVLAMVMVVISRAFRKAGSDYSRGGTDGAG